MRFHAVLWPLPLRALPRQTASAPVSVTTVLVAAVVTLFAAYLTKQGCFVLGMGESFYCHSDYGGIYYGRELGHARFPYLPPALEYPAGLGLILWFVSAITSSGLGFAQASMILATAACFITVWLIWRLAGRRALLFAAAPTLALYAFLNWDLIALVFAVAAIAVFIERRDFPAGALIGVGAAIKVFPGLLLVPFVAQRWREGDRGAAVRLTLGAASALALVNVPVAWFSFDGWAHFIRFNSSRPVEWGSLWSAGCQATGSTLCANVSLVNVMSLLVFMASAAIMWIAVTRMAPNAPRWQLAFPLLAIFFLTNKVYSPQYSLWLLPWFALALPSLPLFVAYEIVDIGIYVTTFAWQQRLTGSGGLPLWPLNMFIVFRAALLIAMIVAFARRAAIGSTEAPDAEARGSS
jgi:hypothetical protein